MVTEPDRLIAWHAALREHGVTVERFRWCDEIDDPKYIRGAAGRPFQVQTFNDGLFGVAVFTRGSPIPSTVDLLDRYIAFSLKWLFSPDEQVRRILHVVHTCRVELSA